MGESTDRTAKSGIDLKELEAVRKVITSLLLARKNFSLYPEGHSICINSLEQFLSLLGTYIRTYGDLRIDVERDRLFSKGEMVHADSSDESSLSFVLFRDGIRWFMFLEGIDIQETTEFLKIINRYSILSDEPEGDIVTEFWENKFTTIKYEAVDSFEAFDQNVDLMDPFLEKRDSDVSQMRERGLADQEPLPDPPIDQASLSLGLEEKMALQKMISLEEESDPTAYLDALFDSLLQYREQENFQIILKVLEEEFASSITRRELDAAFKILRSLNYVLETGKSELPWSNALIEDFYLTISSPQTLGSLPEIWPYIGPDQVNKARDIFFRLQPEAIHTLCTMLIQNQTPQKRQVLIDAITFLASRDMKPLETLLKNPDEKLLERLVPVLVGLEEDRAMNVMVKLLRHPSVHVRQEAIKGALQKGGHIREVFSLIDDPNETIRRLILRQMGESRNQVAEKFLLEYLERRTFNHDEHDHVIACFTVLGQCGSSHALPYLRKTLLHRGWMPAFWRNAHRRGAAIALSRLDVQDAQEILKRAGRSIYPSVRGFVREATGNQSQGKKQ